MQNLIVAEIYTELKPDNYGNQGSPGLKGSSYFTQGKFWWLVEVLALLISLHLQSVLDNEINTLLKTLNYTAPDS